MDNYETAKYFSLLSKWMEIHGENSFKSKNYSITVHKIEQLTVGYTRFLQINFFLSTTSEKQLGKKFLN